MTKTTLIFLAVLITSGSFGQTKKKLERNEDSANGLVGTWKLIDFSDLDSASNTWIHPYGKNPKGYFTYTSNGIVHLNISNENPLKLSRDSLHSTKFVYSDFMKNSVGYFGEYEVSLEDSVVIHKVKGGSIPFYIGTNESRPFILKGDTLIIGDNKTWRRILVRID